MPSPTARTLRHLRQLGYVVDVVERWIPHVNRRRDFLGCIDLLAVHALEVGVLAIQATTRSNVQARLTKARGRLELVTWLKAGNRFQVWGWSKRRGRWLLTDVAVTLADLDHDHPIIMPRRRRGRQRDLFA